MEQNTGARAEGYAGEAVAADWLTAQGLTVLERNVYTPYGEIDIVARDGRVTAFVEVKLRRESDTLRYGRPLRAVNAAKKNRMLLSAKDYLSSHGLRGTPARIDVLELYKSEYDGCVAFRVKYIRHAVRDEAPS